MAEASEIVILIVDDKKANLFALEHALRPVGARVVQAMGGDEALALTLQYDFALAILDVQMPGMDGYELAEMLLGDPSTCRIPIIFVSAAYADEQHRFRGYRSGAVDYLVKPFDPEVLLSKVRVFLELARYRLGLEDLVEARTRALRESEAKYRTLIENAYDIIQSTLRDGSVAFVSPSWERVLEYTREERRHLVAAELVAPECRAEYLERVAEVLSGHTLVNFQTVLLARDGRKVYVEGNIVPDRVDGRIDAIQGFFRDVTARREAETRLELAVRGSGVCLWDWHLPTGVLTLTGETFGLAGHGRTDAIQVQAGQWGLRMHPEDLMRRAQVLARHLTGESDHYECELRLRRSDGAWSWVLDRGRVLEFDRHGEPLRMAGTYLDIEARKRAEEERSLLHRAEAESRAKSDFLARMSHEIRTPMNAILGYAQLLHRESGLNTRQLEHLETINRSGEHLLSLINQVLDLARIEAGHLPILESVVDLGELLVDVERMFRLIALERGLSLRVQRVTALPGRIVTDGGKVRQVLINLLGNALKFTDSGGIEVRAAAEPLLAEDESDAGAPDGVRLCVDVEDTGCGIESEAMEGIFEAFGQTEVGARKVGVGLGLTVSRHLARRLGGDLTVTSMVGKGSVFHFEFQARRIEVVAPGSTARSNPPPKDDASDEALSTSPTAAEGLAALRRLPADIRDRLRDAIEDGYPEEIEAQIVRAAAVDEVVGQRLRGLAHRFDYGSLLDLLGPSTAPEG